MNFFDPSRPHLGNGLPQYVLPSGHPGGFLGPLDIEPLASAGLVRVSYWLRTEHGFGDHFVEISETVLPSLLASYREDPERFFVERLGWIPPRASPAVVSGQSASVNVDEMGL